MAEPIMQYSVDLRDAQLDVIETVLGPSPKLYIYTGTQPANCAATDNQLILASIDLPVDWMLLSSGGVKSKTGVWMDTFADAAGIAGHFRLLTSGLVCKIQGSVGLIGSGAQMEIDNTNFNAGQQFTVQTFSIAAGNA